MNIDEWEVHLGRALTKPVRVKFGRARTQPVKAAFKNEGVELRLHEFFGEAPLEVADDLAAWLRVGRRARKASARLDAWIDARLALLPARVSRQATIEPRGEFHDLGPMAQADRGNPMSGTLYMTSDERWVTLTMPDTDRWWPGFASLIGVAADDPRFDDHEKRTAAHRSELMTVIDEAIRGRSASDWRAAFAERGLSADVIEEFDYPADDVEARRNRYILDLEDSSRGSFKTLGFPIFMSQTPARLDGRAPTRGQHTARILHDLLGLSESEIDALETQGTIRA